MSNLYQKPIFSPVINITKSRDKPIFVSELEFKDHRKNVFSEAEEIRGLMAEKGLTLMQTAALLEKDGKYVANKLRILELSEEERRKALTVGFDENELLAFLQVNKSRRLKTMLECEKNGLRGEELEKYIACMFEEKKPFSVEVKDIGFFANSLKKLLRLAKKMGFEADLEQLENDEEYGFNIRVKKKNHMK